MPSPGFLIRLSWLLLMSNRSKLFDIGQEQGARNACFKLTLRAVAAQHCLPLKLKYKKPPALKSGRLCSVLQLLLCGRQYVVYLCVMREILLCISH